MKNWPVDSINRIYHLNLQEARYREDGKWYHPLGRFPAAFVDAYGYVQFTTREEYLEYSRRGWIQIVQDVHIQPDGIHAIQGFKTLNPPPTKTKPW